MSRHKRQQHVVSLLSGREYNHKDNQLRLNQRILRTLVCGDCYEFRKVWEKTSKSVICFEGDKVFMDNYRTAYDGYGVHYVAPVNRFSLPKKKMPEKIVDGLLSHSPVTELPSTQSSMVYLGTKVYGITDSSFLVIDFDSAQIMLKVELVISSHLNLKDINWMQPEDSIIISSTLHPYLPRVQRAEGQGIPSIVKVLALFAIQPLRFVCMVEITRSIFGKDAVDASLREGLLFVTYRNETVRFFDFNQLLEKYQITPQVIENSTQLKINMRITELPCCLFESKSEGGNIQLGANPWHYLVSPVGTRHTFHVRSLETGLTAENGVLTTAADSVELDRAVFHPDDSSRLIHIGPDEVKVLWIKENHGKSIVTLSFVIPVLEHVSSKSVLTPSDTTSSGRKVKRRFSQELLYGDYLSIQEVCYEDELDLMVVCSTLSVSHGLKGTVGLYHNATGHLLKSVELEEPRAIYMEHKTALDKDTLIQVTKYSSSMFLVQVYRLFEKSSPDEFRKDHKPKLKDSSGFCDEEATDFQSPRTGNRRRQSGRRQRR